MTGRVIAGGGRGTAIFDIYMVHIIIMPTAIDYRILDDEQ